MIFNIKKRGISMNQVLLAFLVTTAAGLFTGFGGLIALSKKSHNRNFLGLCLAFSAGVMIYVSMAEIYMEAMEDLYYYNDETYRLLSAVFFFLGIGITAAIDKFIPSPNRSSKAAKTNFKNYSEKEKSELNRIGIMTAISIAIHNLPEGLVTFLAFMIDPALGIVIAVAIAIHNFPEGIALAVPINVATGNRKKAVFLAFASGLTEPLGALIAWLIFFNNTEIDYRVTGISFAMIAGIMIYISLKQLLPTAHKFAEKQTSLLWALFLGMAIMSLSIVLLG